MQPNAGRGRTPEARRWGAEPRSRQDGDRKAAFDRSGGCQIGAGGTDARSKAAGRRMARAVRTHELRRHDRRAASIFAEVSHRHGRGNERVPVPRAQTYMRAGAPAALRRAPTQRRPKTIMAEAAASYELCI